MCSPYCASAMTALRPMACSRISPMNDLGIHDENDAVTRYRRDGPAGDHAVAKPPKPRARARRRQAGRLLAVGGVLLLGGSVSLGAWGHYSRQQEGLATSHHERDLVPSMRVAVVAPSPSTRAVSLPCTTAAFAAANIYARATGYVAERNVDIGDGVRKGDLLAQLAVPELDAQISQNEATLAQLKSGLEQVQANLKLARG